MTSTKPSGGAHNEGALQVDVNNSVPVGLCDVQEVGALDDAGVGHLKNVDDQNFHKMFIKCLSGA